MKAHLMLGFLVVATLASCGEDDGRGERQTHGNLQANPNFDGSQDKLVPGSRHSEKSEPKKEP